MSLFTSLLEHGHGVRVEKSTRPRALTTSSWQGNRFSASPSIPSLTEILASHYPSFSFNGGSNVGPEFGFFRGFDLYVSNHRDVNNPMPQRIVCQIGVPSGIFSFPRAFYFLHTYQVHAPYEPLPEYFPKGEPKPGLARFDFIPTCMACAGSTTHTRGFCPRGHSPVRRGNQGI